MKKLLTLLIITAFATTAFAQSDESKVAKNAAQKNPLKRVKLQLDNEEWEAALKSIEEGFSYEKTKDKDKETLYLSKAVIYDSLTSRAENLEEKTKNAELAVNAYKAYEKAVGPKAFMNKFNTIIQLTQQDTLTPYKIMSRRFLNDGVGYYQKEEMADAADYFRLSGAVDKADTTGLVYAVYAENGAEEPDYEAIAADCEALIARGFTKELVWNSLLNVYINRNNDNEKGFEIIKKARAAFPDNQDYIKTEINLYIRTNRTEEAITSLKTALAAEPENADLLFNLGRLYEDTENPLAEDTYKKAASLDEKNYNATYSLGAYYFNKGVKIKKEVDQMDLKTSQKDGPAVMEKAKKEFAKAIPYFEKAMALQQEEQVMTALRSAYLMNGETKKAEAIDKKMEELGMGGE